MHRQVRGGQITSMNPDEDYFSENDMAQNELEELKE